MAASPRMMMIHPAMPLETATAVRVSTGVQPAPPAVHPAATNMVVNPFIFRNPTMGILFWNLPRQRSAFSLPTLISPTATPNDQTLFDEPQPGGKQHYLPAYKLATTGSGNQTQFAVSLAVSSSGYLLTVKLVDVTSMSLVSSSIRETPATLYILSATLPNRTETWDFPTAVVDGTSITLTMPFTDPAVRDAIYTAMTDQSLQTKLILRRSPALALPVPPAAPVAGQPPPQQLYRQSAVAIDTAIDFYFDKNLDQSIFANLPHVGSGTPSTLNHVPVAYPEGAAKSYSYWQDPLQPGQIYFLPDSYKIARLATSPHTPAINIATSGSDPATLNVTLTFFALPVWDLNRIAAAAAGPLLSGFSISKITSLSILPATTTQLLLNLPSTDSSASTAPVAIANASIDTANGIQGSVTMPLAQFQQVYNAMFVTPSVLLSGQVNVTVDQDTEHVPFSGRASDFTGDIFDSSISYDATANQVTVTATNGIESPIHINALADTLLMGTTAIPTTPVSTSPSLPVDLVPVQPANAGSSATNVTTSAGGATNTSSSSSVSLVLQLASGQSFDPASCTVQFDLSRVTVNPDSRAIWQAIVQNQVVAPVKKQITIQLPAQVFPSQAASTASTSSSASVGGSSVAPGTDTQSVSVSSTSSGGSSTLLAVQVVFDNGQTATFQPSMTAVGGLYTQTIGLNVDIEEFILGQGDSSNYTYRVDTITATGTQHGDWVTTNVDDLFVTLND
jgi:hypothetical protein